MQYEANDDRVKVKFDVYLSELAELNPVYNFIDHLLIYSFQELSIRKI